jgi:surfeit locus 1 family protein
MSRRAMIAAVAALAMAALFARLGIWQVHRLGERRALNAELASRQKFAPVPLAQLPTDTSLAKYRTVRVTGRYDFDHQIIVTGRSRQGAPGVNIVTPLLPETGGPAVLVNRGYVYSPDASTIPLATWNEPEHATVQGFVLVVPERDGDPRSETNPMAWRTLDRSRIAATLPYPVAPVYIINLLPGERAAGAPTRLEFPSLDEGSHKSYAIQWFTFSAIALYGVGYLFWLERRKKQEQAEVPRESIAVR